MTAQEMEKFMAHCEKYFGQPTDMVLHSGKDEKMHIDILRYAPTEKYPFWKLVTMGASDYKMPRLKGSPGDRNEYMLFVHPDEDLTDHAALGWYFQILLGIANYPAATQTAITYGHSIEWGEIESGCDMEGVFFEFPQMIETTGILRCKLSFFKTVICLQAVTLTRADLDHLQKIGPQEFSNFLYPEEGNKRPHFLCEKKRSERF